MWEWAVVGAAVIGLAAWWTLGRTRRPGRADENDTWILGPLDGEIVVHPVLA